MPARLTRTEVERIAALAHLALTDDEKELFARQLAEILAHAEQIQQIDTTDVPPTTHVLTRQTELRADAALPGLSREAALANAPEAARDAGFFKVPRVIG